MSDHLAVLLDLDLNNILCKTTKSPFWKLNTSVLEEDIFREEFEELWERLKNKKRFYKSLNSWWERVFKKDFQKMTQNNCKEKKRDEKQYRDFLTSCLREAKEKIDGGGEDCIQEYSDLRHEYKNLINRVEKGRKLRGKIEAQGPNELSSIANLMKKRTRGESKLIKKIKKGGL